MASRSKVDLAARRPSIYSAYIARLFSLSLFYSFESFVGESTFLLIFTFKLCRVIHLLQYFNIQNIHSIGVLNNCQQKFPIPQYAIIHNIHSIGVLSNCQQKFPIPRIRCGLFFGCD